MFFSLLYQASNFSVVYYVVWSLSLHAWIYTHVDLSLTPGAKCLRSGFLSTGILVLLRLLRKDFPERFVRRWGRRLGQAKEVSREMASAEAYYSMISREALELNGSIRFPTLRGEICTFEFPVLFSHWSWATSMDSISRGGVPTSCEQLPGEMSVYELLASHTHISWVGPQQLTLPYLVTLYERLELTWKLSLSLSLMLPHPNIQIWKI